MVERGYIWMGCQVCKEEFEDTKGVIRIRKSKKNRQHNEQKKKYKRTNNDLTGKIEFGTITVLPIRNTCVTINHGCVPFIVNTSRSILGLSL
jgi:hypothetical protein